MLFKFYSAIWPFLQNKCLNFHEHKIAIFFTSEDDIMFKSAMGYLGGVTSSGMTTSPILDSPEDALVGSIVDVGGQKVIVRKRVGEGGFAFVYKVEDVNESSRKFALKRLLAMDEEKRKLIVKEISLMKSLSGHPSIVKFVSAAEAKG